jgi:hypothetical protein
MLTKSSAMIYFNTPDFSDLTLTLRDPAGTTTTVAVHKVILASSSEFFKGLLSGPFREAGANAVTVEVPDIPMALDLLKWMYTRYTLFPASTYALAKQWLVTGAIVTEVMGYPGLAGTFVYREGSWKPIATSDNGKGINRTITYDSITPGSTLERVIVQGYPDGRLRLVIEVGPGNQFADYMKQYNFLNPDLRGQSYGSMYMTENDLRARLLLEIILRHNTFSHEDRQFLEGLLHPTTSHLSTN